MSSTWFVAIFAIVVFGVALFFERRWSRIKIQHEKELLALDVSCIMAHEASLAARAGDMRAADRFMELSDLLESPERIRALYKSAKADGELRKMERADRRARRQTPSPREKAN